MTIHGDYVVHLLYHCMKSAHAFHTHMSSTLKNTTPQNMLTCTKKKVHAAILLNNLLSSANIKMQILSWSQIVLKGNNVHLSLQ